MGIKERARNIKATSITCAIFLVIFTICAVVYFNTNMTGSRNSGDSQLVIDVWFIVGLVCLFPEIIFALIGTIMILATDWKYPKLQKCKTLWGLLSLFLLGFIAQFIFSWMALKCIKSEQPDREEVTFTTTVGPDDNGVYL